MSSSSSVVSDGSDYESDRESDDRSSVGSNGILIILYYLIY